MSYYRIILADDEEEIREGIIRKIAWQSLGFEIAGAAENGLEALEMAERLHPDVILTDIRMPFMSGLEMAAKAAALLPSVKFIILSGYDDFEYAKKAIQLNVVEYLLKPVNAADLTEVLQRLKIRLDEESASRRDVEALRRHYEESLPVIKEQFLVSLLEGRVSKSRLQSQAKLFQLSTDRSCWSVGLIHADLNSHHTENSIPPALHGKEELVPISLLRTAEEILGSYCQFQSFLYSEDVALLFDFSEPGSIGIAVSRLNEICKRGESILGMRIFAGIGSPYSLSNLHFSYREAQNALDYGCIHGYSRANYIKDVEPNTSIQLQFGEEEERTVISAIKLGGENEIRQVLNHLFSKLEKQPLSMTQYQIYIMEVITTLMKITHDYAISPEDIFGKDMDFLNALSSLHTPTAMKSWLTEHCLTLSACIKRERVDSSKLLAQNAQQFIQEHYSNPSISVETLCSFLHVSPAYFSTVFKRETEQSFVSYLTDVRLQNALNLLDTTNDKTYMIAEKVGYTESNYFSYVFKKRFGVSPSKYRSNEEHSSNNRSPES